MSGGPLSERSHYDAFVKRSVTELQRGLDIDDTSAKDGVSKAVSAVLQHSKTDAATKVLCARFALGGDDAAYLQSGLAVLWSTVAKSEAGDDLTLAPAALYSPDAVGGIRRGLLRALEAKHKEMEEDAADNLAVLVNALGDMLDVPTLQGYKGAMGSLRSARSLDHAALAQELSRLKGALDKNASGDLAASILDRVNCLTELIKTRARAKVETNALKDALGAADATRAVAEAETNAIRGMLGEADANAEAAELEALQTEDRARTAVEEADANAEAAELKALEKENQARTAVAEAAAAKGETRQAKQEAEAARNEALEALRAWYDMQLALNDAESARNEAAAAKEAEAQAKKQAAAAKEASVVDRVKVTTLTNSVRVAEDASQRTQRQADDATRIAKDSARALEKERDDLREELRKAREKFTQKTPEEQEQLKQQQSAMEQQVLTIDRKNPGWNKQFLATIATFAFMGVVGFLYISRLMLQREGAEEEAATADANSTPPPGFEGYLAPYDDPHVATALVRGLVGQRGPTEPATSAAADARLAYALPPPAPLAKSLPVARALLERLPAPAEHEVDAALAALAKPLPPPQPTAATATAEEGEAPPAAKRTRVLALPKPTPASVLHGALAEFGDNFAVIGATPAAEKDARAGIESVHEVRWLPQGPRAATMAQAAVLEHAIARCGQLLEDPGVAKQPSIAQAVRDAAVALKLRQLEPLYALHEAVAFDDAPHPLGTAAPLITRPCAVVRGALAYPIDAGVVPVPPGCKPSAHNAGADVKGAMEATKGETAALRNALRREGVAANVYVAPPAEKLGYESVARAQATGAATDEGKSLEVVGVVGGSLDGAAHVKEGAAELHRLRDSLATSATSEVVFATDFALPTLRRLVNQCIVTLAAVKHGGGGGDGGDGDATSPIGAFLQEQRMQDGGGVDANDRREALWTEFHRHLSISQDRLWIFVRLLSGSIGGDVNEVITMADEASQQATRALQAQRVEVAKRVSDTQAKIVESVVSTMLKESKLAFDARADNLVVMDTEARRDLRDLASGASGRPYFEANVAARNLSKKAEPMKLSALLTNLAAVGAQMQRSLDSTLAQPGLASASLIELSHPSNSYFVSMRTDASTAIRIAHERCNSELAARGVRRRIALWELVEGGCTVLTTRFAEFTGHILVQNRASTGVSAMYVPHVAIETNVHQARVALARLTNAAETYATRVPPPSFGGNAQTVEDVKTARREAMDQGGRIKEHDVGLGTPRGNPRTGHGHLYRAQSATGWWVR